jgi:hypothetical protein
MKDTIFFRQAELLLRILPLIHKEEVFALKGGTAINFFVRDLPRLSVDIDLTYLPVNDRDSALNDIRDVFEKEFKEMTTETLSYEELCATRETLVSTLMKEFTTEEKHFLVSVKEGVPGWGLLGLEGVENLPAVKWKLLNIGKMEPSKHKDAVRKLKEYLAA